MIDVSYVILNWKTPDLTSQAIESIRKHEKTVPYEIIVVDNASGDGSVETLASRFPWARIIASPRNLGFAGGNNLGARHARGEMVLLFNSDAYEIEETLPTLMRLLGRDRKGKIITCTLLNPDGSIQPGAFAFPTLWSMFLESLSSRSRLEAERRAAQNGMQEDLHRVGWVSGALVFLAREDFERVGGMDESIFMYAEDIDFARRAESVGLLCYYTSLVRAVHIGGGSINAASVRSLILTDNGRIGYWRKWHGQLSAAALRSIFAWRSFLRMAGFSILGLLPRRAAERRKARMHATGLSILLGVRDARDFA